MQIRNRALTKYVLFNLFARWFKNNVVEGSGSVYWVESCKIMFLGALPIHLFRHFCCRYIVKPQCSASWTHGQLTL